MFTLLVYNCMILASAKYPCSPLEDPNSTHTITIKVRILVNNNAYVSIGDSVGGGGVAPLHSDKEVY